MKLTPLEWRHPGRTRLRDVAVVALVILAAWLGAVRFLGVGDGE